MPLPSSNQPQGLQATRKVLPARYKIKENEDGRFLTCVEEPHIAVWIKRNYNISASAARKYPSGSIFLDGAAQAEPFMDVQRGVYNLDHHEGCVRAFTLATCEQAMVLIRKGLDLTTGEWNLYANEPDLDTVMAIWLFLNHRRINDENPEIRQTLMPVIRLQGIIDAHGLELRELSGFPEPLQKETLAIIDHLRALELELKKSDRWSDTDVLEYTLSALGVIDETVYSSRHFDEWSDNEELARFSIGSDRIAVVCRSELGVYEVEQHLRKTHGNRFGLLILQKDPANYTLRQVDSFLPTNLEPLYDRLNTLDPAVRGDQRWGGATDIGGSPRSVGTRLGYKEIVEIGKWVFHPKKRRQRLGAMLFTVTQALAALVIAFFSMVALFPGSRFRGFLLEAGPIPNLGFAGLLALVALVLIFVGYRHQPHFFGLREPRSAGWLALLPSALLAAGLGGAWAPMSGAHIWPASGDSQWWFLAVPLAQAIGCELLFRGAMFGLLVRSFKIMRHGGPWFLSWPTVITALLSTAATLLVFTPPDWLFPGRDTLLSPLVFGLAALAMGLVCALARERWGSLIAPIVLHAIAATLIWGLAPSLFY